MMHSNFVSQSFWVKFWKIRSRCRKVPDSLDVSLERVMQESKIEEHKMSWTEQSIHGQAAAMVSGFELACCNRRGGTLVVSSLQL